jgi:CheY-specific phosphatase CheX
MQASEFAPLIAECCAEVLDAMYFTTVLETTHESGSLPAIGGEDYAFSLRFQGDIHGTFGVKMGAELARTLASNFLGEEEEALSSQEIGEVAGELANMLCGSVVSRVEGRSKFVLTHPEPLRAVPAMEPRADMLMSTLDTDNGPIHVWVLVDAAVPALREAA